MIDRLVIMRGPLTGGLRKSLRSFVSEVQLEWVRARGPGAEDEAQRLAPGQQGEPGLQKVPSIGDIDKFIKQMIKTHQQRPVTSISESINTSN